MNRTRLLALGLVAAGVAIGVAVGVASGRWAGWIGLLFIVFGLTAGAIDRRRRNR